MKHSKFESPAIWNDLTFSSQDKFMAIAVYTKFDHSLKKLTLWTADNISASFWDIQSIDETCVDIENKSKQLQTFGLISKFQTEYFRENKVYIIKFYITSWHDVFFC